GARAAGRQTRPDPGAAWRRRCPERAGRPAERPAERWTSEWNPWNPWNREASRKSFLANASVAKSRTKPEAQSAVRRRKGDVGLGKAVAQPLQAEVGAAVARRLRSRDSSLRSSSRERNAE